MMGGGRGGGREIGSKIRKGGLYGGDSCRLIYLRSNGSPSSGDQLFSGENSNTFLALSDLFSAMYQESRSR